MFPPDESRVYTSFTRAVEPLLLAGDMLPETHMPRPDRDFVPDVLQSILWMLHQPNRQAPQSDCAAMFRVDTSFRRGASFVGLDPVAPTENPQDPDWQPVQAWLAHIKVISVPGEPDDMGLWRCHILHPSDAVISILRSRDDVPDWLPPVVLRVFLIAAARAEHILGYDRWGEPWLASLPLGPEPLEVPPHFGAPMEALLASDYCEATRRNGVLRWTEKVAPHMEAVGLWPEG